MHAVSWKSSLVLWFAGLWGASACAAPADFVLLEGRVHTLDPQDTVAQAVAIGGERIVCVGSDEAQIPQLGSVLTVVGGKIVYQSGDP